jgi:hypothetical protein
MTAPGPLPSFVLVTTLAVAIGANASIYTVAHSLLIERLPFMRTQPRRVAGGSAR